MRNLLIRIACITFIIATAIFSGCHKTSSAVAPPNPHAIDSSAYKDSVQHYQDSVHYQDSLQHYYDSVKHHQDSVQHYQDSVYHYNDSVYNYFISSIEGTRLYTQHYTHVAEPDTSAIIDTVITIQRIDNWSIYSSAFGGLKYESIDSVRKTVRFVGPYGKNIVSYHYETGIISALVYSCCDTYGPRCWCQYAYESK